MDYFKIQDKNGIAILRVTIATNWSTVISLPYLLLVFIYSYTLDQTHRPWYLTRDYRICHLTITFLDKYGIKEVK